MSKKKIKKGRHYCTPFPFPLFYIGKNNFHIISKVKFNSDCAYDIGKDQSDINKLIGISYGFHHNQSDRIGWRYLPIKNKIELLVYSYISGVVTKFPISTIDFDKIYDIEIKINIHKKENRRNVVVYLDNKEIFNTTFKHNSTFWGYTLGLYFGGNCVAPHTMHIEV